MRLMKFLFRPRKPPVALPEIGKPEPA